MLDSEKYDLLIELEPSEYFRIPLLHDRQLLRAEVMRLLVELAAAERAVIKILAFALLALLYE